jgi:hypothetical protein
MTKRLTLSLLLVGLAFLIPSTGFAGRPGSVEKYCTYWCQKCGTNRVQTCSSCDGVSSCDPCHTGTICAV